MGYMEADQNLKWHNLFHDNQEFSNLVLLKACVGAKWYWKTGRGISPSVLMVCTLSSSDLRWPGLP